MKNKKQFKSTKKVYIIIICVFLFALVMFLLPWDSILKSKEEKEAERVILEVDETNDQIYILMGDEYKIKYSSTLDGNVYESVSFVPANKDIISVSEEGVIVTKAPGVTTLYIASGNKNKTITVNVIPNQSSNISMFVSSENGILNSLENIVHVGEELTVTAKSTIEFDIDYEIEYKIIEGSDFVSLNENKIKVHAEGAFTVRASFKDKPDNFVDFRVVVIA